MARGPRDGLVVQLTSKREELIATWLRNARVGGDAHLLGRLVRYHAETGWRCVLAVHRVATDTELSDFYQIVEDLLVYHGPVVIERVISLAHSDASFRERMAPLRYSDRVDRTELRRLGDACGWLPAAERKSPPEIVRARQVSEVDINPPKDADAWRVIDAERNDAEIMKLAQAYVECDTTFWAFTDVWDFVREAAVADAWELVKQLIDAADDELLGDVAAGPLEDFLGARSEVWIEVVERDARRDPRLREALRGVWQFRMSNETYARVRRAATDE